jgi:hypothetical protein
MKPSKIKDDWQSLMYIIRVIESCKTNDHFFYCGRWLFELRWNNIITPKQNLVFHKFLTERFNFRYKYEKTWK